MSLLPKVNPGYMPLLSKVNPGLKPLSLGLSPGLKPLSLSPLTVSLLVFVLSLFSVPGLTGFKGGFLLLGFISRFTVG